jgi:hypothetical protein
MARAFAELRYGLDGFDDPEKRSLAGLIKMPFMNGWRQPGAPPDDAAERLAPPSALPRR